MTGAVAHADPVRMADPELAGTFHGRAFEGVYPDSAPWQETYNSDGSLAYTDRRGAMSGQWSIRDGSLCTFYRDRSGACWRVERAGENCFRFYVADEDVGPRGGPVGATGWDKSTPAACGPGRPVS